MPRPPRPRRPADDQHVLPLRPAVTKPALTDLLASVVATLAAERRERGLPPIGVTLDASAAELPVGDVGLLVDLLGALVESACEAAAAAPPRLREVVVTTVAGPDGLEIEVADSGPGPAAGPEPALASARPLAERLGGTLTVRGCPEGGTAVTLHLPRRGRQRQAA